MLFSFASGIFHPYYVSLLAPFLAALVGAGAGELFGRRAEPAAGGPGRDRGGRDRGARDPRPLPGPARTGWRRC